MDIKFLTYNIHKGFNWSNSTLTVELLKSSLHKINPDIIFLQEVVGENKKLEQKLEHWIDNQIEFLAKDLWPNMVYSNHAIFDHRNHGNVILSKFPINRYEIFDISINSREKRALLFCEIIIDDNVVHTYCTHLNLLHRDRLKQYGKIESFILRNSPNDIPIVLAGDFNDWNQKAYQNLFKIKDLHDAHKTLNGQYAKTFPSFLPFFKLDRFYIKGITPISSEVLKTDSWKKISDHLPIFVKGIL